MKCNTDWDAKYAASSGSLFGDSPNEYVREVLARSDFTAASALCLADGDGRNGTWLAKQGLKVTALDLSKNATEHGRNRDREAGVEVERITCDVNDFSPGARIWQAVFLIYLQSDPDTREHAIRLGGRVLAPGGWLVLEGFSKEQARRPGKGPGDPSLCYGLDEVRTALPGFQFVEAFAGSTLLSEGDRHSEEADIIRLAARKPI